MISLVLYYLSLIINKLEDFEDFIEDYEKLKLKEIKKENNDEIKKH